MPFTLIAPQTPKGPYIAAPAALALAITLAAMDAANGNEFALTGHEVLIIQNPDTAAHTITLNSSPDSRDRSQDITAYNIPAGGFMAFSYLSGTEGWEQTDGTAHVTPSSALLLAAVLYVQR
jgi:hypothetical protein